MFNKMYIYGLVSLKGASMVAGGEYGTEFYLFIYFFFKCQV